MPHYQALKLFKAVDLDVKHFQLQIRKILQDKHFKVKLPILNLRMFNYFLGEI